MDDRQRSSSGEQMFQHALEAPMEQTLRMQRGAAQLFVDGLEIGTSAQRRGLDLTRNLVESYIENVDDAVRDVEDLAETGVEAQQEAVRTSTGQLSFQDDQGTVGDRRSGRTRGTEQPRQHPTPRQTPRGQSDRQSAAPDRRSPRSRQTQPQGGQDSRQWGLESQPQGDRPPRQAGQQTQPQGGQRAQSNQETRQGPGGRPRQQGADARRGQRPQRGQPDQPDQPDQPPREQVDRPGQSTAPGDSYGEPSGEATEELLGPE